MAENHWGVTASATAAIALLEHWLAVAGPVAGVGLFGLFPSGRPERAYERVVIWTVALAAFLLPLLEAVSEANIAPAGGPPDSTPPVLYRALWVPDLAPLGGPAIAAAEDVAPQEQTLRLYPAPDGGLLARLDARGVTYHLPTPAAVALQAALTALRAQAR